MTRVLLQVNFDLDPARNEDFEATARRAEALRDVPGLIWKLWLRDSVTHRAGGLYLFADRASADRWANGRFETMAERMPWSANITHEFFEVEERLSRITGAALDPLPAVVG